MKTYPNPFARLTTRPRFLAGVFLATLFSLAPVGAWAQTTNAFTNATYTFTGTTGDTNSFAYNGSNVANLTEGNMVKSSGITSSSSSGNFRANNWTTGSSLDTNDYIGFTLTPDTGWTLNMTNITFGIGRSGTGTTRWAWYYSTNSFTNSTILTDYTTLATGLTNSSGVLSHADLNSSWTGNVLNLGSLTNLGVVEFRLYSWLSEAGTGTAGLQGPLSFSGAMITNAAPPSGSDYFWTGNGTTLGGSGTWDTTGTTWSAATSPVTGVVWDPAKKAIFTNSADTVTVSTVTASNGVQFATDGYTLTGGTLTLGGEIAGLNTITTDAGVTATINTKLSGAQGMVKAGSGTLILGGANDYTGSTLVSGGRLVGTTTSLQGDISIGTALTFDQATNGVYAGAMTGLGSLRKSGAGEVTLSGANNYEGGTEVAGGRLIGDTLSLRGAITNNAAVTFSQTTNGTYSGAMTGTGSLRKAGIGTITLEGVNTYSGGTEIADGGLIGTTTNIQGAITNNGTLTFNQAGNGTHTGAITGDGDLIKEGVGTVTLTGANDYIGATVINAGGLAGSTRSLPANIFNYGTVIFDQSTNGTYAGDMTGSGVFVKDGSGTITMSGVNSYAGGTTVNEGALIAENNNSLGSGTVSMADGAVFAQHGVTVGNDIVIGSAAALTTNFASTAAIAGWDMNGLTTGATTAAGSGVAGVSVQNATLGAGISNQAVANALGGAGWNFTTVEDAVDNDSFVTFGISATATNTVLKLSTIDPFTYRSSSTGPTNATLQYSLDGGTTFENLFTTNGYVRNTTSGSYGVIDISDGGSVLQNVGTNGVTFRWVNFGADAGTGTWYIRNGITGDDLVINGQVGTIVDAPASGTGTLGIEEVGSATFSGGITIHNEATFTATAGATATFSGAIGGDGTALEKTGAGTVMLSGTGANTFAGTTTVSEGTLHLNKTAGTTALAGDLEVASGATLLISASNQVANTSAVTLSGGTIVRGSGVSETFGDLTLTSASTLDYGSGAAGTLQFGDFAPSDTTVLTLNSFLQGNKLRFSVDLSSFIDADFLGTSFSNDYFTINGMTEGFTSSWNGSTFTITSVPEPSTYVAAAGLLALMLWPARRRLLALATRRA